MGDPKPKLLIVDDEVDMLDFCERVLRRKFDITRTSSPEDAVTILADGSYEVLLTDQKMPRMSGLELLEQAGQAHPRLVKVLISGFTEMPDIQKAVERGSIHNYIVKPVDGARLEAAIDEAVAVRDSGRTFTPKEH